MRGGRRRFRRTADQALAGLAGRYLLFLPCYSPPSWTRAVLIRWLKVNCRIMLLSRRSGCGERSRLVRECWIRLEVDRLLLCSSACEHIPSLARVAALVKRCCRKRDYVPFARRQLLLHGSADSRQQNITTDVVSVHCHECFYHISAKLETAGSGGMNSESQRIG